MNNLISEYLAARVNAWSPTTLKSEAARLNALAGVIDKSAQALWDHLLTSQKPYSRVTSYTRVVAFYDWAIEEGRMPGPNLYKKFKKENARLFKHAYSKKIPDISMQDAEAKIAKIADRSIREKCLELLKNGMRFTESLTRDSNNMIVGKGGKKREVYGPVSSNVRSVSYFGVWAALRTVGLKPHDLRKIFATDLYRKGLDQVDVAAVMGWSNFQTAASYIAPSNSQKLRKVINERD